MEPWSGIADADAHLGRPFPLPAAALPLARWVEVRPRGPGGVEVEWNLDDTRSGSPGRLALYAGTEPPPDRAWEVEAEVHGDVELRTLPGKSSRIIFGNRLRGGRLHALVDPIADQTREHDQGARKHRLQEGTLTHIRLSLLARPACAALLAAAAPSRSPPLWQAAFAGKKMR